MRLEIPFVQCAASMGRGPGLAFDEAHGTQALEVAVVIAGAADEDLLERLRQPLVVAQQQEMSAEMIAERTALVGGHRFESGHGPWPVGVGVILPGGRERM